MEEAGTSAGIAARGPSLRAMPATTSTASTPSSTTEMAHSQRSALSSFARPNSAMTATAPMMAYAPRKSPKYRNVACAQPKTNSQALRRSRSART